MDGPDLGWLVTSAPDPNGNYDADACTLGTFLRRAGETLAELPARRDRDAGQQRVATAVHTAARRGRHRFLARHAERVHAELTDGSRAFLRIADLAEQASELVPGLVPTKEQMTQEYGLRHTDKEGWETDQGIFFHGLLRSRSTRGHVLHSMRRPTAGALAALPAFLGTGHVDLGIVTVRRDGQVGEVTVNNARVLNAEDNDLVAALEVAVDLVLLDDSIRVGVMRGAQMSHPRHAGRRVFSAGINLTALFQGTISLIDFFLCRELGYLSKIFRGLSAPDSADTWLAEPVDKPWIGVVDSFAIGGGTQLLLVFDRVIAEQGAYFSLPALREGIIPGAANLRLPRVAGNRLSRQFIYADRQVHADTPEGRLLCDEVVPADRMTAAIEAAATELANPAVRNNRRIQHDHEEPEDVFGDYMASYAVEQCRRLYRGDLVANLEQGWMARKG